MVLGFASQKQPVMATRGQQEACLAITTTISLQLRGLGRKDSWRSSPRWCACSRWRAWLPRPLQVKARRQSPIQWNRWASVMCEWGIGTGCSADTAMGDLSSQYVFSLGNFALLAGS